jgi:hypothetical protein
MIAASSREGDGRYSQTKTSLSVFLSLSLFGAERLRTRSCCCRKRISASRETRDRRVHASSALKSTKTLSVQTRDYPIDKPALARMTFSEATGRLATTFSSSRPERWCSSSACRAGNGA